MQGSPSDVLCSNFLVWTIQSYASTQAARAYQYNNGGQPTGIAKVISSLAEIGMGGIRAEDLAKLFAPDKMEPALERLESANKELLYFGV